MQIKGMYQAMTQQQLSMQGRYGLSRQATSTEAQNAVMTMIEHSDSCDRRPKHCIAYSE